MYLCDITLRKILNIKKYELINSNELPLLKNERERRLSDITSFYLTLKKNISCIGFIIDTINGEHIIPVIGMRHIRIKIKLKNDLQKYIYQKSKMKKYNLLLEYSNLPIEIIDRIIYYY